MTIEEMQQRKRESGLTYQEISERSGISLPSVQRIMNGTTENPRAYTLAMIEAVLNQSVVREGAPAFAYMQKKQGDYTEEDYNRLPEEERCELIDGVIYELSSPTDVHQLICGELHYQLKSHVRKNKGKCIPFAAPSDVRLEHKTIVQPDVYVVCNPKINKKHRNEAIPDFVAEVVSQGTKRRDYIIKLEKYIQVGIKEYWILDYKQKLISVYLIENSDFTLRTYGFYDDVPVTIWNGECIVNMSDIKKELEMYD